MAPTASDLIVSVYEARFGVLSKQAAKCEQHGDFIAIVSKHTKGPSGCPVCAEDARKVRDQEIAEQERIQAAKDRLERRLGAAMIPPRFAGKSFGNYRATTKRQGDVLQACRQYAIEFKANYDEGRCLLLVGNVGTGKTHLAAAIAESIITDLSGMAVYRTLYSLMQYVKGSFGAQAEYTEAQAYENLIAPHLLIIDEIGATKQTEFEQATLFNVINGRYEQQRPTLIISNLMPDELEKALGDRVMDRLRENGGMCLVFDWGSARREASE